MPPNLMVVHLGGNDLTVRKGKSLILDIIHDLQTLKDRFPSLRILWSNVIPWLVWRPDCERSQIDHSRQGVNWEIGRAVRSGLDAVIQHPDITIHQLKTFRVDGVHMSDLGMDIFLRDLQGGLQAEIFGLGGRRGTCHGA